MHLNATFLISAISFVIFVLLMNTIFYKPVSKIVKERKKLIDENYDMAKRDNNISEKLTAEREEKLQQTKSECKTVMEQKLSQARENKNKMLLDAQEKSTNTITENKKELDNAYLQTKSEIKNDVSGLANEISQKLFGEKVALKNIDENSINKAMQEG